MALTSNDPRPVLRKELERVFKNQRVIRAFEKIFDLIPPEFIDQQDQIDGLSSELTQLAAIPPGLNEQVDELRKQVDGLKQDYLI